MKAGLTICKPYPGVDSYYRDMSRAMSALGQELAFPELCVMSALPPKADILQRNLDVR
jgi:hypothetical protein